MNITVEWLKEQRACPEDVEWISNIIDTRVENLYRIAIKENKLDWANWTMTRLLDRKNKIRYAVFAAEQVLDIFEKEYPEDKRPRKAIEAAKKVAEDDSEENRRDSNVAANASYAAALAAHVALADSNVAANASYAATLAAHVATNSTFNATFNTANAIAYVVNATLASANAEEIKIKILDYGMTLLREQEKTQ